MKRASPEELAAALDALAPQTESKLIVLDRSELENWDSCPFKAKAIATGRAAPIGELAEVGEGGHQVFGAATKLWVQAGGHLNPGEVRDELEHAMLGSRPDLQPKVIDAVRKSLWAWVQFIIGIDPSNIRHFDGGDTLGRSGQLSMDVESAGVRLTSEVDLIYSGPSKELLHETDYKSGFKFYTAADVKDSFQFCMHALLVFSNYENVNGLEVSVWNTRTNNRTFKVVFYRDKIAEIRTRIMNAVGVWYEHHASESPPTWPTWEKCCFCEAAAICPEAHAPIADVAQDPVAALNRFAAIEANYDKWKAALAAHVDRTKQDIVSGSYCFGREKPKPAKRAPATLYQLTGKEEDE